MYNDELPTLCVNPGFKYQLQHFIFDPKQPFV